MAYVKLFDSLIHSTIWSEPLPTRVVWITMLAMADRDGVVHARAHGIAKQAGVTRGEVDKALACFLAPDPDSRSQEHEGRRVMECEDGWKLLNYEAYRDRQDAEERRAKDAARQARKRARDARKAAALERDASVTVTPCHDPSREVTTSAAVSSASAVSSDLSAAAEIVCEGVADATPRRRRPAAPARDATGLQIASAAAWDAYRVTFAQRYGEEPLRNKKVNGQIRQFAQRVPHDEIPAIVRTYLQSQNARYVQSMHSVGCLLQDAEALRTEMVTGRSRTAHQARETDKREGRRQGYEQVFRELDEEDAKQRRLHAAQ